MAERAQLSAAEFAAFTVRSCIRCGQNRDAQPCAIRFLGEALDSDDPDFPAELRLQNGDLVCTAWEADRP